MAILKIGDEYLNLNMVRRVVASGKELHVIFAGRDDHEHYRHYTGREAEALRRWLDQNSTDVLEPGRPLDL
jgi:hypothetical protein